MQFKKGIICAAALALLSMMTVMLTSCGADGKMLSDSELADVLSKKLGAAVEITEAPEGSGEGTYSMKCANGTEFTVDRMVKLRREFGPRYYDYKCDYLVNWVHDHPELNAAIDAKGLYHEDFARGSKIIARDFEETHIAAETACKLVEDRLNYIPAVSDIDEDYELRFMRPVVMVCSLNGEETDSYSIITEFSFSDGTETADYDEELEVFLAEREYVDNVRHGDIDAELSDELLEKYGPSQMKTQLMQTEYSLMRARNKGDDIQVGKTETLYYLHDYSDTQHNETLDFPVIASWAECTGFAPCAADGESYTLARGEEKVVFRFSDSGCFAERSGERTALRGTMERSNIACDITLMTEDLTKLFDTELKFDCINGTAEITNKIS